MNEQSFPQHGWKYLEAADLGLPRGRCACCGAAIRYVHFIRHIDCGTIGVGCECAARLTMSQTAYVNEDKLRKAAVQKERYMNSPKWEGHESGLFFKLDGYWIRIWCHITYFNLEIGYMVRPENYGFTHYEFLKSKRRYSSAEEAKSKAFDVITTGRLKKYLESRT